jgi:hypothetical protein
MEPFPQWGTFYYIVPFNTSARQEIFQFCSFESLPLSETELAMHGIPRRLINLVWNFWWTQLCANLQKYPTWLHLFDHTRRRGAWLRGWNPPSQIVGQIFRPPPPLIFYLPPPIRLCDPTTLCVADRCGNTVTPPTERNFVLSVFRFLMNRNAYAVTLISSVRMLPNRETSMSSSFLTWSWLDLCQLWRANL